MSSELKNKLLSLEATPPPQVWMAIAAELDESAIGYSFTTKLKSAVVAPPTNALSQIFAALDEEAATPAYAAALYQMEVQPPAQTWHQIKKNLDTGEEAGLPTHRSFVPFIKYAAAAAVAGLLFWGGLQIFSGNKKGDTEVATTNTPLIESIKENNPVPSIKTNEVTATNNEATEDARSEAALEASKKVYASVDVAQVFRKAKKTSTRSLVDTDVDRSLTANTRGLGDTYETADDQLATPDKYVVLMTPDGKIIRMSKNLSSDMVSCASGEEQDKDCIDQMTKWRKQIAEHPKALSPGNFLDIIGLVNSLQED